MTFRGSSRLQKYLAETKNPFGYCGIAGTGVACPAGLGVTAE